MPALRTVLAVALAAAVSAAAAAPDGGWRVAREGSDWVIEASAGPREAIARRLAELSGSTWAFAAGPSALAGARPMTLRWRGRDLAAAWAAVLEGQVSHAVQCAPRGCRVWVLGLLPSAPATPVASAALTRVRRTPGTVEAGIPWGDEPPAAPMTEDPPGLFPSD